MKYYILAIKNYATFQGRSSRQEYWMFVLFNILFIIAAALLDELLGTDGILGDSGAIQTLYSLFVLVPGLSAAVRRLHDVSISGWWFLRWNVISAIVSIMYFAYLFIAVGAAIFMGDALNASAIGGSFVAITLLYVAYILAAIIWLLVLLIKRGTPGPNKYGPNPAEVIPNYTAQQEM